MRNHWKVCAGECGNLICILKRITLATDGEYTVEGQEWAKETRLFQLYSCEVMGT